MALGEIAAGAKLASVAAEGFTALKRLQPEYGKFWKSFRKELEPQSRDLPWERLEQLRLDPEFVGEACGLIRGDHARRKAMRKRMVALAKPPEGGRYDAGEIVEIVMRAADESAVEAARDDRDVTAQRGRLLEGQLADEIQELRELIEERLPPKPLRALAKPSTKGRRARAKSAGRRARWPAGDSRAEIELSRILRSDPAILALVENAPLPFDEVGYRPDFVVKDRQDTNWLIEVKAERSLRLPNVREHTRRLVILTTEANRALEGSWRYAIVTPEDLDDAHTWGEVLARSAEKGRTSDPHIA